MRLLRTGPPGAELPCAVDGDGVVRCLSAWVPDWTGAALSPGSLAELAGRLAGSAEELPEVRLDEVRVGPPVPAGGQLISVGLNYRCHAAQAGMAVPAEPVISTKSPWALAGPYDDLLLPPGAERVDWEVELAVVIGTEARYLPDEQAARAAIAGYCTANDVSERSWLLDRGGQWVKGKSFETFAPLGPYLVTADEVDDVAALRLTTRVNGQVMQDAKTGEMVFGVPWLIRYLTRFMVLRPGDVVLTGSPAGVALRRIDEPYLRPGDVVEVEVETLGAQRQRCRAHPVGAGT
ncbi:fumarylacetoacetate hydrolase family protein [Actinophytocola xanthii]|uniref:2-hydroxyhepta-2,4-diene-1,7-dioate isomerase n=1 Tax=Actinophytocola xanthii TaxID=1912961 RepID=A0A1Q8CDV2_9PSEU|nr:fumarylacetoacetate hydrolase family protein [Actinophytocola xanthii]OLF12509.1 2-hydroxyhepta-2,4-diene-1,7-dioate isomerase [Actinophytocola xanthii]